MTTQDSPGSQSYYVILGNSAMECVGAESLYPRIVPGLSELL